MFTVMGFASHLAFMAAEMEAEHKHELEQAAQLVEKKAKSVIGTYAAGWPPLAASTLARKSADTPLLETGGLRNSIQHGIVDHNTVEVGSNDQKAVWHELGTTKAPPRSFLVSSAQAVEKDVIEILERGLTKPLGISISKAG